MENIYKASKTLFSTLLKIEGDFFFSQLYYSISQYLSLLPVFKKRKKQ